VSSALYEPFGPLAQLVYGNGSKQTFTFDQRYRPSEDKLVNGSTTTADYLYQEDSVGNITQIHDNIDATYNRDFGYDDLSRLTTANSGLSLWGTATGNGYTYDLMGNIKSIQLGSGRTASFAYSGTAPKLSSVTENGTPRSVSYDSAGNEIAVGTASYNYTPRNVLASGDGLSYLFDGWGRRGVSTTLSGSRYSFYGPDITLLSESNVTTGVPTVAYDYIWFNGRPVAQTDSTGVHYTVADHLGTPLLQTDSSNNVYWRAEHEPYGKVWALRAGDAHQPLRLPGQVTEQFDMGANGMTERSYNNHRWYRPGWGRYTQSDPIGLAGDINPFRYAWDSPVEFSDPTGLDVYIGERPIPGFPGNVEPFHNWPTPVHTFLIIDPLNHLRGEQRPNLDDSSLIFIAGLHTGGWYLGGALFCSSHRELFEIGNPKRIAPPSNESEQSFENDLITRANNFPNGYFPYTAVPGLPLIVPPGSYNSAGFIVGLLQAAHVANAQALVESLPDHQFGADFPISPLFFPGTENGADRSAGACGCTINL
jgi:RHS repeat-associated protein